MRSAINTKWIVLIGLPIIMWKFYSYVGFNQELTKLLNFVVSFIVLVVSVIYMYRVKSGGYERYVRWIIGLFLVSLVTSFLYWGQSPSLTYRAGVALVHILYFYVLKKYKVTEQDIFKLVAVLAAIYTVLWLYAISQAPSVVFGNLEELNDNRGFYRIMQLPSKDTVCLLYFLSLVRTVSREKREIWLLVAICCFLVIFLSLSRMLVFSILMTSAFFLFRKRFVMAVLASGLLIISYSYLIRNEIVSRMITMTETQLSEQEDNNLRMVEYKNAFTAYPFHVGTTLFGNGAAHIQSAYGKYDDNLKSSIGFNVSDAGYVGVYVQYGIAMLVVLLLLLVKVVKDKVPMHFQPFRLYIISLFVLSLTSYAFWGAGISFSICLYVLTLAKSPDRTGVIRRY